MDEQTNRPVLEYRPVEPRSDRRRRRTLLCVGLPLIAFAMGGGLRFAENGLIAAAGALLVALALPVRD